MNITDVRLRTVKNENEVKLKAYADITLDGSFVIHGLKVIDGQKGMFVAMPSRKMPNGEFKDIAHPITPELRRVLTEIVIKKYDETIAALAHEEEPEEVVETTEETTEETNN
jgi:stage V sporulation protein G